MKQTKKWLALLLLLGTVLGLLACTKDGQDGIEEPTQAPEALIELIRGNASDYRIVRPENATEAVKGSVISFCNELEAVCGVKLEIQTDGVAANEANADQAKEILIGDTVYEESRQLKNECSYGDYLIRPMGNKLVIVAYDDATLRKALTVLCDLALDRRTEDGSVTFTREELTIKRSSNSVISALAVYDGEAEIIDCADKSYLLLARECTADGYIAYCNALLAKGYKLYTSQKIAKNSFATYVSDTHTVNISYLSTRGQMRVSVEEKRALPLRAPAAYSAVTTPSVTMLGLEHDGNQIGLGMIFRLSDGSFVILDGGNNKASFADRLYQKLRELSPDPDKILIRAWLFSHCHTDHVGTFIQFTNKYQSKVRVENFIFNFTTDAVYDSIQSGANRGLSAELRAAVSRWSGSQVIKAHTGQKFYFADGVIDILYTAEDVYPATFADGNTESLVFRMELGGQTILCLGDEYTDSSAILSELYGSYLKSDILQASHHGRNGATAILNTQIRPDTVLWPGGKADFAELSKRDYNRVLLNLCKDLYIAGSNGITLELPYTVQNNKNAAMQ